MKTKKSNKIIEWFIEEGALTQEKNLYIAERIFKANSFVNWLRKNSLNKTLSKEEIEQSMLAIRMFLQNKINLSWKNGIINISDVLLDKEESTACVGVSTME